MHGTMQGITILHVLLMGVLAGVVALVWGLIAAVTAVRRRRRERAGPGQHDDPLAGVGRGVTSEAGIRLPPGPAAQIAGGPAS